MAHPESQPKEVRIGNQDFQRRSELLTQFPLIAGRRQGLPPSLRELVAKFLEQVVGECPQEVIPVSEMLVERRTTNTSLLGHNARGEPALATGQD